MKRSIRPASTGDIARANLATAYRDFAFRKARERVAATLGLCLAWVGLALVLAALTGCAGLNVSWSVVATYNTPHATPGDPVAAKRAEPAK